MGNFGVFLWMRDWYIWDVYSFCSKSQVQAMLSVDLHCEQEMLGKVYAVLSKRRAKVQGEVLREGTSIFYVHAFLYLVCTYLGTCLSDGPIEK